MNQARELLRLVYPMSSALAGGRASRYWQRELARSKARLDAFRRSSGWVESLVADAPVLHDEPLMGRCLAVLTDQHGRPAKLKPEASGSRRPRFTWPERLPGQVRERAPTPHRSATAKEPAFRRAALPILSLHRQANRELLSRLAAEAAGAVGTSHPLRRLPSQGLEPRRGVSPLMPPGPKAREDWLPHVVHRARGSLHQGQLDGLHRSQRASQLTRELPRIRASRVESDAASRVLLDGSAGEAVRVAQPDNPFSRPTEEAQRVWLREVARRAESRLSQDGLSPRIPWRALPRGSGLGQEPSLADQWAISLNGPPAPEDLLVRLADAPIGDIDGSRRETEVRSAPQNLSGPRSARSSVLPAASKVQSWQRIALEPTQTFPVLIPPELRSEIGDIDGKMESPARITPPAVAPSLPSLIPPEVVGAPVAPVAAVTARQGARDEATAVEADLSLLAARIKRILDEEARRHGIDV